MIILITDITGTIIHHTHLDSVMDIITITITGIHGNGATLHIHGIHGGILLIIVIILTTLHITEDIMAVITEFITAGVNTIKPGPEAATL